MDDALFYGLPFQEIPFLFSCSHNKLGEREWNTFNPEVMTTHWLTGSLSSCICPFKAGFPEESNPFWEVGTFLAIVSNSRLNYPKKSRLEKNKDKIYRYLRRILWETKKYVIKCKNNQKFRHSSGKYKKLNAVRV